MSEIMSEVITGLIAPIFSMLAMVILYREVSTLRKENDTLKQRIRDMEEEE